MLCLCVACCPGTQNLLADDIKLKECPAAVRQTIEQNLLGGNVDEIKEIRINDHVLYIVEIDLKGFREARLYIAGDGALRKIVEEIKLRDLPVPVRQSLDQYIKRPAQVEDIEKVTIEEATQYHIEIKQPKIPDRTLIFEEDGSISSDK